MKRKTKLLIVDDEPNICKILQAAFERAGFAPITCESGEEALAKLKTEKPDVILTDVLMPGITGVEFLAKVKESGLTTPVIIMTAHGTIAQAVEAMKMGAADYITKPFDLTAVKKAVSLWAPKRASRQPQPQTQPASRQSLVGESPAMLDVKQLIDRIADSRATVLLTGESGTGKEVVAKAIHRAGNRASGPFIAVNCAALPETLLESELFGTEKGAFTGADFARPGRFELANGGTLFLDEIGEIPLSVQVKLLRVLQEREIERLGGVKPISVDVRLIAATNKDLPTAVEHGAFREDLLFRLQVLSIELPPLRDRPEDIEPLASLFIARYAEANGSAINALHPDSLKLLQAFDWPGNVRELENIIERAVVLAPKEETALTPDLLPPRLLNAA